MSKELDVINHLDIVNKVASEYLMGNDVSSISVNLNIPRHRVVSLLDDWRSMASNNEAIRERAREALVGADQHFSSLIKKTYEVIDSADQTSNLNAKTTAIKLISDIETKRLDMLHKAGLLENKEMAEHIAETERKQLILINILKDIATDYPEIRKKIMTRLSEIQTGAVIINDD